MARSSSPALLWWGGIEILDGTLTFGALVAFMQYTQRFYLPIRDASAKFSVMQAATVAAERVFALLDAPPEATGRGARVRGAAVSPVAPADHGRRPSSSRTSGSLIPAAAGRRREGGR